VVTTAGSAALHQYLARACRRPTHEGRRINPTHVSASCHTKQSLLDPEPFRLIFTPGVNQPAFSLGIILVSHVPLPNYVNTLKDVGS
jgi:hypothetical protein